jgi:hypothetical protein
MNEIDKMTDEIVAKFVEVFGQNLPKEEVLKMLMDEINEVEK